MSSPSNPPGTYDTPPAFASRQPVPGQHGPDAYGSTTAAPGVHPAQNNDGGSRSLGDLISEITTDLSTLVQQEIALAKAEATQSAKRAGKGAGMFGGAGFAGYFAVLFLSIALWWALGDGMGHGWSALIVAVLWIIVAAVLALRGKKEFADIRGFNRTTETLGKIPNAVKGNEEENR